MIIDPGAMYSLHFEAQNDTVGIFISLYIYLKVPRESNLTCDFRERKERREFAKWSHSFRIAPHWASRGLKTFYCNESERRLFFTFDMPTRRATESFRFWRVKIRYLNIWVDKLFFPHLKKLHAYVFLHMYVFVTALSKIRSHVRTILGGHTSPGRARCCKPNQAWQDEMWPASH